MRPLALAIALLGLCSAMAFAASPEGKRLPDHNGVVSVPSASDTDKGMTRTPVPCDGVPATPKHCTFRFSGGAVF